MIACCDTDEPPPRDASLAVGACAPCSPCSAAPSPYSAARLRCSALRFDAGGLGVVPARADELGRCGRLTSAGVAAATAGCAGCGVGLGPVSTVIGLSVTF